MLAPRVRSALTGPLSSTWLLGLVVAVLSWNVAFLGLSYGLDPSWWSALYMAAHQGMHFGTQIVFTYGPLAFLRQPWLWYDNLAIVGFVYQAVLLVILSVSVVWAFRRTHGAALAAGLGAVLLLATPARDTALALTGVWCLVALQSRVAGTGWILAVGGAVLGAVESLVEISSGPVILGAVLITLVARRDWRRLVPTFVLVTVVAFAALWLASGQSFGNLGDYLVRSEQIVSGYSEAMGRQAPGLASRLAPIAMIVIAAGLIAGAGFLTAGRRQRIGAALALALILFALYKEGAVRADPGHETIFFSTAAVLAAGLAYGRRRASAVAAVGVVLALSAVAFAAVPANYEPTLNPVSHVRESYDQIRLMFSPGRRARIELDSAVIMAEHYKLDRTTLGLLSNQTVQVNPWEAAVAWVYRLHWDPVPVFQGYSAYTSQLDQLDSHALSSPAGPTRILRENTLLIDHEPPAIDSRVPAWDPPLTTLTMLCRYVALRTTPRWEVLGRTPNRCAGPRGVGTVTSRYGQVIRVPTVPGRGILYAKVYGLDVSGLERVRTFLYRAAFRYAIINGHSPARVVPGTAADGLLLDAAGGVNYPAPFALSPQVQTLEFTGSSGPLRIDFEWMTIHRSDNAQPG